jgi:hypothetical protein
VNDIFKAPEQRSEPKQPVVETFEHEASETVGNAHVDSDAPSFEDNTNDLLSDWNQPTAVPTDHFAADAHSDEPELDEDEEPEIEEPEIDDEEVGLDAESLDIISEAVVQSNDEGAKFLINWLNGPEADKFPGAGKDKLSVLQKAWKGILLRIKYKPSGWDALLAAEWNAYGWHLMAAFFSFVGRWIKGAVRWPWQTAKKIHRAVNRESETTTVDDAEVVLKGSDFVGKESETHEPEPEESSSSEPVKICLETNKPFRGEGSPRTSTKHPELVGKFKDMGAFRAYCNKHGLSGPKAKKKTEK